jgi:hypothetical protein
MKTTTIQAEHDRLIKSLDLYSRHLLKAETDGAIKLWNKIVDDTADRIILLKSWIDSGLGGMEIV